MKKQKNVHFIKQHKKTRKLLISAKISTMTIIHFNEQQLEKTHFSEKSTIRFHIYLLSSNFADNESLLH